MPATKNIEIYRGDTYVHELRLKDSANAAINISNMSFSGAIKTSVYSENNTAVFTTQKTDSANGVVLFTLTSSVTANINPGTYLYDFQQINGSVVITLLTGKAIIKADIS